MPARLILLLLAAALGVQGATAGDDVRALAAAAPADAYPHADAVVLLREVRFDIDTDGRLTRRERTVTRLQTQWAMRNLSDARVPWDSTRQDLQVHTCRTFMADGTEVPSPANAFNEVTPDAVDRAVPFLGIRELVISHVGTEPGCVVELDYEIRDREPAPLPAWGEVFLRGRWPVKDVTVSIAPADLAAALVNGDGLTNLAMADASRHSWTFRDLPALPASSPSTHEGDVLPYVVFSTTNDWGQAAAALRAAGDRACADLGPALRAWLEEGDDLTRLDTVQRIAGLVHDGVRAIALPTGAWSRAPRPVAEVHASAVATPWEQALLAQALLAAAGFEPEIGFFTRWQQPAPNVAALGQLADVRVVAPLDGQNWWLAPDRDEAWPGPCDRGGRTGLFLENAGGVRTWRVPASVGECRLAVRLSPTDDGRGLTAAADLEISGTLRQGRGDAGEAGRALASRLLPGSEAPEIETRADTPLTLALRVAATGTTPEPDPHGLVILPVPFPDGGLLAHLPAGFRGEETSRDLPLVVDHDLRESVTVTWVLPEGLVLDAAPATRDLDCALGSYRLSVQERDGEIVLTRDLDLGAGRCEPADYASLREMILTAQRQDGATLILRRR